MDRHVKTHKDGSHHFSIEQDLSKITPINTMMDIGCNLGDTIVNAIGEFHPKKVYGFEASRGNFLASKVKLSIFPEVELFHTAVSDFDGTAKFFITEDHGCNSMLKPRDFINPVLKTIEEYEVPVTRVDTWAKKCRRNRGRLCKDRCAGC